MHVCATAVSADGEGAPVTLAAQVRYFGLSESTSRRLLRQGEMKRASLTQEEITVSWCSVQKRNGYTQITLMVKLALHKWILEHPHVVNSPLTSDVILVKDKETGKKSRP